MSQVLEEKDHVELLVSGEIPLEELGCEWLAFLTSDDIVLTAAGRKATRVTIGLAGTEEDVLEQMRDLEARGLTSVSIRKVIKGEEPAYRLGDVPVYA